MDFRLKSGETVKLMVKPSDLMEQGSSMDSFFENSSVFLSERYVEDEDGATMYVADGNNVCGCAIGAVMYAEGLRPMTWRARLEGAIDWFNNLVGSGSTPYYEFGLEDQTGYMGRHPHFTLGHWVSSTHSEGINIDRIIEELRRVGL